MLTAKKNARAIYKVRKKIDKYSRWKNGIGPTQHREALTESLDKILAEIQDSANHGDRKLTLNRWVTYGESAGFPITYIREWFYKELCKILRVLGFKAKYRFVEAAHHRFTQLHIKW